MRKTFYVLLNILLVYTGWAQPIRDTGKPPVKSAIKPWTPDKNIVMDYFQNQQFTEAIDYLQPAFTADSSNLTVLGWLGYANYMSEDRIASQAYNLRILQLDSSNISALSYLVTLNKDDAHVIAMTFAARLINCQAPNRRREKSL
jgi:hypothetical protein